MKKLQANYLISDKGNLLKNGIVVAEDDGTVLEYIDTSVNLVEIAGTSFHNGILMTACHFFKSDSPIPDSGTNNLLTALVLKFAEGQTSFSFQNLIDLGKAIQENFPEMKIPEIMNEISEVLQTNAGFSKENIAGIFLLTGVDLPQLRFKPTTKLKKII